MQGREHSKGMSKSEMGLQSLSQGSRERVWNREGQAGSGPRSSENRTKVCGWMGYTVGDLRSSLIMEKCGLEFRCGVIQSVTTVHTCEGNAADKATMIDYSKTGANKR